LFKKLPSGLSRIRELDSAPAQRAEKSLIVEMDSGNGNVGSKKRPEFDLRRDARAKKFSASIRLPGVASGREVDLDVGEDRLVLSSEKYELDIFLPLRLDAARAQARFVVYEQLLTVETPIFG
jgi:hypothetical protein